MVTRPARPPARPLIIVGYLAAGGRDRPWGLSIFRDPGTLSAFAERGVVMLLFLIGLELKISRFRPAARHIRFRRGQLFLTALALGALAIPAFG